MESDLRIRVKVHELLSASLKAEHYGQIQEIHPDYNHVDHDDPDNLLYFLEKEKQCVSIKTYYGLIVLLNQIGLSEVANKILAFHDIPEEKYVTLKNAIEEIFKDRKYKKEYMGELKNRIIECYKLPREDILHCTMDEIIGDLEESRLLSRNSSHILTFQNVFKSCGCKKVFELIQSFENVLKIKETPVDTSDAGAAPMDRGAANITPQQRSRPTQEQNQGNSETTGGGDQFLGNPSWQTPTTGAGGQFYKRRTWQGHATEAPPTSGDQFRRHTLQGPSEAFHTAGQNVGSGFQSANPHPYSPYQPHSQRHMQEYHQGPSCIFNSSNIGTNFNIASGTSIGTLIVPAGNPGQGTYGGNYGQDAYGPNYGQGTYGGNYGQDSYGGNCGQGAYRGNYGQDSYGGNCGQGGYGGDFGQGGQGLHREQDEQGQGYPRQGDPGQRFQRQGGHQYFPRQ